MTDRIVLLAGSGSGLPRAISLTAVLVALALLAGPSLVRPRRLGPP